MRQLLTSAASLLLLSLAVFLAVLNTVQINALEKSVLRSEQALRQLVGEGGLPRATHAPAERSQRGAPALSAAEVLAFRNPNNILTAPKRPLVTAYKVAPGGVLRTKIGQDPRGLNPYIASGADVVEYNTYVGNTLASRSIVDPDTWVPDLALSVVTPDDGLSYTIELRKGVLWHRPSVDWQSGRYEWLAGDHELTSDDVAFAFDIIKNPQVAGRVSSMRNYFEAFDRYEIVGPHTLRVYFKQRLFTNLSALLSLQPMPRWLYMYDEDGQRFDDAAWGLRLNDHWYNQKAIGTGPYVFVTWQPGVKLEFLRNDRYFGERPAFDKIVMAVLKDQNTWVRKLKTGEIDFSEIQPEQYRTEVLQAQGPLLGNEHIKHNFQPTLGYFYLGWNADTSFFADKRVRQAMTLALNRTKIIKNVFHGLGKLTTGPFAQQSPCYDKTVSPWPFDLEAAAKKLQEAGWRDLDSDGVVDLIVDGEKKSFEFTMLIYGSSSEYQTLAQIYREDLMRIGVRMTPRALEWSTMLKKMDEKEFDAYTGAWALDWESDLYQLWHSSEADNPKGSNRVGFRNAKADAIAEALRREFDPQKRVQLCHQFHGLVHDEQPYTFIYQRERPVLYWDYLNEPEYSVTYPHSDLRRFSFREARP